jgi:hypothetical protein
MRRRVEKNIQTTLRLPRPLYVQVQSVVKAGLAGATVNDLVITALREHLRQIRNRQIDAAFAGMAHDAAYQETSQEIIEGYQSSDWEALQFSEND